MTPLRSGSSSSAAGTMLKFAAMGVISVPQKPLSMPSADMMTGSPPKRPTMSGRPMPGGHHRKGRKGVAHDDRKQGHTERVGDDGDRSACHRDRLRHELTDHPADAGGGKQRPSEASVCGSTAAQPTASMSRRPSRRGRENRDAQQRASERERNQHCHASAMRVACAGSKRVALPMCRYFAQMCRASTTTGIARAGTNRRLPLLCAAARRSATGGAVSACASPLPRAPPARSGSCR
jgi:hypothetical protein